MAHSKQKSGLLSAIQAIVLGAAVLLVALPATADPVTVAVSQQPGAGRITFTWPRPVPFVAQIENRQLVVQFGRPVESSLANLPGALSRYIGAPRLAAGNQSVIFPLQGSFDLNYFAQGNAVIVEIVDTPASPPAPAPAAPAAAPAPQGAPKAAPAPLAAPSPAQQQVQLVPPSQAAPPAASPAAPPAAAAPAGVPSASPPAERIAVRTGEHPQYGRIVFDWERDVGFKIEQRGNRALVTFERPAAIALDPVVRGGARNVAGAASQIVGGTTVVTLNVPSTSRIQSMKSGPKVVIDVYNPTGANDAAAAPTVPLPQTQAAATPAPPPPPSASAPPPPAAPAPLPSDEETESNDEPPNPPPAASASPPALQSAPAPLQPPAPAPAAVAAAPPPAAQAAASSGQASGPVEGTWRVDWTEPVGAAVFRRAGSLWIVFDRQRQIDTAAATKALGNAVRSVTQVDAPRGSFIRLVTAPDVNPTVRRDGFAWIFDFRRQPLRPTTPIEPKLETGPAGDARMVIAVAQPGEALPLRDPEVGDNVVVVPIIPLGSGVERPFTFPQFEVLPSSQGIVVRPRIDDLRVRPTQRGVELSGATASLSLSSLTPQAQANARIGSFRQVSRILAPDTWRIARRIQNLADFNKENAALLDKVADASPATKQQARLDYAQFLLANDWSYEAIGVLDTMASLDPAMENKAEFRLLRGAAEYLMDRYEEAEKDFAFIGFNDNDEGEFWRAIIQAASGKGKTAAPMLKAKGDVFRSYPRALKMKLGQVIADAALAVADVQMASSYLEVLAEEKPQGNEIDQLALIEGKVHQLTGNFDQAVQAWEAVEKGSHRPSMAEAIVLRANLLLGQKKIQAKDAIAELEKLRYSWRGGEFEFDLLHRLGRLYIAVGDYRNGLRTLQEAVTYFREMPESARVTEEMVKAFDDLYLKDAADGMTPVRAIALFDEFKELAPSGEPGDEMIRKLADRLASVDLLDRAAILLEDQIQFRLKGVDRARVGTRLATVYLLNREPKEAQVALEKTRIDGLPPELESQRRHLLARSLVDQGRVPDAEKILDRDESAEADQLRAEIYWGQQDWLNAAKALQKVVSRAGAAPNKPLSEEQAQLVLNFAIAVTLSGNDRGVVKLRQDFGPAMAATSYRDAFNLIASPNAQGLVDYRTLSDRVKVASNFTSFMDNYKKRMKDGKLSSLN